MHVCANAYLCSAALTYFNYQSECKRLANLEILTQRYHPENVYHGMKKLCAFCIVLNHALQQLVIERNLQK